METPRAAATAELMPKNPLCLELSGGATASPPSRSDGAMEHARLVATLRRLRLVQSLRHPL